MLNTRELEQRWIRYKIKTFIPIIAIFTSIVIIIIFLLFIIDSDTEDKIGKQIENLKIEQNKSKIKKDLTILKETTATQIVQKIEPVKKIIKSEKIIKMSDKPLLLKPSLNFMKKMQNSTLPYYKMKEPHHKYRLNNNAQTKKISTPIYSKQISKKEKITKNIIVIKRQDSRDDIENIISRFKKRNNPALSLFIAKKYYKAGNYSQSYNYALITNKINRGIEESWIIFAKSLVKLHKKEMAIETLKEYIKSSSSNNARLLLEDIQSGKFK